MNKVIAIIFGGKSAEYEVSLKSATNITNSINRTKFIPILFSSKDMKAIHTMANENK